MALAEPGWEELESGLGWQKSRVQARPQIEVPSWVDAAVGLLHREVMPSTVRRGSCAGAPGCMGHNARSDQHYRRGARKARIPTKGRAGSMARKEIHTLVRVQGGIHFHADPMGNKDSAGNNTLVELEDRAEHGAQRVS